MEKILAGLAAAVFVLSSMPADTQTSTQAPVPPSTIYTNPLSLFDPKTGPAVSCPDPAIIKQNHGAYLVWYLRLMG